MDAQRIEIVTPVPPRRVHNGNRTTADRWRALLGALGHEVVVTGGWSGRPVDVLVALHAHKSADAIHRFADAHPDASLVVALTGTDLYRDLEREPAAERALRRADALVVLQERAMARLPVGLHERTHVIHQSVGAAPTPPPAREDIVEVAVVAHLREVKDPFLAARAVRLLPSDSRIEVVHCGAGMDDGWEERARREAADNPRWHWLGERPWSESLELIGRARLLAVTSRLEGGANVVSEALAMGTPVLATEIEGSVGLLGEAYPGYVPVGDARALATALRRFEREPEFCASLRRRVEARRSLVDPERELAAWRELLERVTGAPPRSNGPMPKVS